MTGPDTRPEIRLALIMADGSVETIGRHPWEYYEALPAVGDIVVEPNMLDDEPEAMVVVGRQFIQPPSEGELPRWWLILRPAEGSRWREVVRLDDETNQAFAEMTEERHQEALASLLRKRPSR